MRAASRLGWVAVVVVGIGLIASSTGCSSSGRVKESEKAVEGFQNMQKGITKAQQQVDATLASLSQLQAGGDLQKSYKSFSSQKKDLQKTAEEAKKRSASMRENMEEYVQKWEKEMGDMNDPSVRATLESRRQAVRTNFQKVRDAGTAARDAYQPFMAQLDEIERALAVDLNPATVTGMKPAFDKAQANGATLKQKLTDIQTQLNNISAGLSPTGTAPKS